MNQLNLVCLSLTPNLRCVGFTLGQFEALIIPPVIEVIMSLFFIYLYSGPARRAQILLAADGILYFIWALLDMLSHVIPAARISLSIFKALDFLVGAVSFTPILVYSIYLYQLSLHHFIPTLPRKLQGYLEISLPILLGTAIAINEVSSFVGTYLGVTADQHPIVKFTHNSESLWYSLSRSSLVVYTILQFQFFLLAFSRLSRAILDQRRIELTHSDEHHYFHGITWITTGILVGVVETIAGFAEVSFGLALARRILRSSARAILMYGLLKGVDVAENFETLRDELRGVSHISRRISRILGIHPSRANMFQRISQSSAERAQVDERALVSAEKQSRNQRVTVHYEKGQAPVLQIRFSTLDLPAPAVLAEAVQPRRRSLSGWIGGRAGGSSHAQQQGGNVSDEMTATRNAALETRRAKSAISPTGSKHHIPLDWIRPPDGVRTRQESGGADSDNLSIVRELERKFPNLPPRVTGRYRGSILGENYEEDPFPVVGISRQSSLRRDGPQSPSEEGSTSVALSSSGSIKRKPAPPLLENISERRKRPASSWGGLTQGTVNQLVGSPVLYTPTESTTTHGPDSPLTGEPTTPRSRRMTARNMVRRVSRAMSDASIRSAEWLASANSSRSARTPLTVMDIEMYRRGNIGPGSARPKSAVGDALLADANPPPIARSSTDEARANCNPYRAHTATWISIGEIPVQSSTPTTARSGSLSYEPANLDEAQPGQRTSMVPG